MNICFVVPDGTGIRNYLFSNIMNELKKKNANIFIWHALTDNAIQEVKKLHPEIEIKSERLPGYKEGVKEKFLRESIAYARLKHNTSLVDNDTIMVNWRKTPKKILLKLFFKLTAWYGGFLSKKYKRILRADEKYRKIISNSQQLAEFKSYLQTNNIETVLCTHQRAITAIPAMEAANEEGVKTISAIYSWDNMPKARLNTRSRYYVVWSQYMKEEVQKYYPEIDKANIVITGTPQFEFYYDKKLISSREEFYERHNLNIEKKIICFSGDDLLTSPYDPEYLRDLALTIQANKMDVQILLRRSPVDLSGRFDKVANDFKDIIKVSNPIWNFDGDNNGNWTLIYPTMDDVELLVNTAYHCDTVYNVGSTMSHDFAMFDKPGIYINYDQKNDNKWSTKTIYKYQHFRSQLNFDAVVWISNKNEIYDQLNTVFEQPNSIAIDRKKWLDAIAQYREESSSLIAELMCS